MRNQPRVAKILVALIVSMTFGAVVLLALGNNPPSAGPFCLNAYYRLAAVEDVTNSAESQYSSRWNRAEVYYSNTKSGNIKQLAALHGIGEPSELNCHFVVCNGSGGEDGQILKTSKWDRQWSVIPDRNWFGTDQTIRICIIGDGKQTPVTDCQLKRTEALVEYLYRKFDIKPDSIFYPTDWQ